MSGMASYALSGGSRLCACVTFLRQGKRAEALCIDYSCSSALLAAETAGTCRPCKEKPSPRRRVGAFSASAAWAACHRLVHGAHASQNFDDSNSEHQALRPEYSLQPNTSSKRMFEITSGHGSLLHSTAPTCFSKGMFASGALRFLFLLYIFLNTTSMWSFLTRSESPRTDKRPHTSSHVSHGEPCLSMLVAILLE